MLAQVHALALCGLEARPVYVEVDLAGGLPMFDIVGLPDASVRESRERVRAGLRNSGYDFPMRRITVNLAPADIRKAGAAFDLPIALGVLAATGQLSMSRLATACFVGELALDGGLRGVQGALCYATTQPGEHVPPLIVMPASAAGELSLTCVARPVRLALCLQEVVNWLRGGSELALVPNEPMQTNLSEYPDLADVHGQADARRALEIAAAGRHNLLLQGPPGEGKTMLANRLRGILPPTTGDETLAIARIYSAAGLFDKMQSSGRPIRAPHHTISPAGMVGGARSLYPGEVTLAHNGILFLDEMAEFRADTLAALRQPMEDRYITLGRGMCGVRYPADFQVIGATNPCPCGWLGDTRRKCRCTDGMLHNYRRRMSGPLLDRFDLFVNVHSTYEEGHAGNSLATAECSAKVRVRVLDAWQRQLHRSENIGCHWANSRIPAALLREACAFDSAGMAMLDTAATRLALSARAVDRVVRVARTIADLAGKEMVSASHIAEAVSYRY